MTIPANILPALRKNLPKTLSPIMRRRGFLEHFSPLYQDGVINHVDMLTLCLPWKGFSVGLILL